MTPFSDKTGSLDAEFSSLLTEVWMDRAPVEALADWIREKLTDTVRCVLATHECRGVNVHLSAERFYGEKNVVHVVLYCPTHYWNATKNFTLETLTTNQFTVWLTDEMNELSANAIKSWWLGAKN